MKILILLFTFTLFLAGCQNQAINITNGKQLIEDFAKESFPGYEIIHISCASMDTNDDGYLRATLSIRKGEEIRILRIDVSESGDPLKLQKASSVSLAPEQLYNNKF